MDILLSHGTALAFWRNSLRLGIAASGARNEALVSAPASVPAFDAQAIRKLTLDDGPVHILVNSPEARAKRADVLCHVCGSALPPSCVCRIGSFGGLEVHVASPELCFVQMCSDLSFLDRLMLGFELCGTYRTRTAAQSGFATRYDMPRLTSVGALERTAAALGRTPGTSQANRACGSILDNSASPAETALAIMLTLPNAKGGYGLPKPQLNPQKSISLPAIAPSQSTPAQLGGRPHRIFRPDLHWPDRDVSLEYDSREFHSQPDAMMRDALRYNDLQDMNCTVFIATPGQLKSVRQSDKLAQQLCRALGVRMRIRCADFRDKQAKLRRALGYA